MANVLEQQNNSIDDYSNDDLDEGLDFDNTEIVVVVVYSFIIKRRRRTTTTWYVSKCIGRTKFEETCLAMWPYNTLLWFQSIIFFRLFKNAIVISLFGSNLPISIFKSYNTYVTKYCCVAIPYTHPHLIPLPCWLLLPPSISVSANSK